MDQWEIYPRQAAAAGMMAQQQGLARLEKTWDELYEEAKAKILGARGLLETMMEQSLIAGLDE
jgi:hypothetical protein